MHSFRLRLLLLLRSFNGFIGMLLWLWLCTDLAWSNPWLNVLFAPSIAIFGITSLIMLRHLPRKYTYLWCLPSIIGGLPHLCFVLLMLFPPFLLGTMFWVDEHRDVTIIQHTYAPDQAHYVDVSFYAVGAYSAGNGRVEVCVHATVIPFLQRCVYFVNASYTVDEDTTNYVSWKDANTLYIAETQTTLTNVGDIHVYTPIHLRLLRGLLSRYISESASAPNTPL